MYAIHSTLLPPSAIHHTLYLPHFTPSTIYPLPRPSTSTAQDIKVVGNLVIGGLSDLRVFEIREELRPVIQDEPSIKDEDHTMGGTESGAMVDGQELGDSFFDTGPSQVRLHIYASVYSPYAIVTDIVRERHWNIKHIGHFIISQLIKPMELLLDLLLFGLSIVG